VSSFARSALRSGGGVRVACQERVSSDLRPACPAVDRLVGSYRDRIRQFSVCFFARRMLVRFHLFRTSLVLFLFLYLLPFCLFFCLSYFFCALDAVCIQDYQTYSTLDRLLSERRLLPPCMPHCASSAPPLVSRLRRCRLCATSLGVARLLSFRKSRKSTTTVLGSGRTYGLNVRTTIERPRRRGFCRPCGGRRGPSPGQGDRHSASRNPRLDSAMFLLVGRLDSVYSEIRIRPLTLCHRLARKTINRALRREAFQTRAAIYAHIGPIQSPSPQSPRTTSPIWIGLR